MENMEINNNNLNNWINYIALLEYKLTTLSNSIKDLTIKKFIKREIRDIETNILKYSDKQIKNKIKG